MPGTLSVPLRRPFFLAAAVDLRLQPHGRIAAAHVQRADPFRAVDLVRRKAHQVDLQGPHIDGNLADRLRGVAVQRARRAHGRWRAISASG